MRSFSDWGTTATSPPAWGRQDWIPGEGTRRKVNAPPKPAAAATLFTGPADAVVRLKDAATVPAATAVKARARVQMLLNITNGLLSRRQRRQDAADTGPPRTDGVGGMLSSRSTPVQGSGVYRS